MIIYWKKKDNIHIVNLVGRTNMKSYKEIYEIVKSTLSEYRFFHSECVANRCVELASIYQVDKDAARLVGIVHDIAKEMPPEEKVKYCKENHLEIDEIEKDNARFTAWKNCGGYCQEAVWL